MVKENIEVGQTIFVTETGLYESKPNLTEYKVTRVNGSSFYAYRTDSESKHESRFDRKKMICKTGYGYTKTAFLSAEEYWDKIERGKEVIQLRTDIKASLNELNLDTLREIQNLITATK